MKSFVNLVKRASSVRGSGLSSAVKELRAEETSTAHLAVLAVSKDDEDVSNVEWAEGELLVEDRGDYEVAKVLLKWSLAAPNVNLSTSDRIFIIKQSQEFDGNAWNEVYGFASGKSKGEVWIALTGLLGADGEAYVAYYWSDEGKKVLSKTNVGKQFTELEKPSEEVADKAKQASMQANNVSGLQHQQQGAYANVAMIGEGVDNPLLSVPPQESEYEGLLKQRKEKYLKKKKLSVVTVTVAPTQVLEPTLASPALLDIVPMPSNELQALVQTDFDRGGFVFAGAGISMAAPSSSPSWWALMNDLLKTTFEAVPEELAHLRQILATGDVSRQPEEIMESFYFFLKDRLLTVFELLERGEPNANHIALAKLAKAGKLKAILTTNFDRFIERALMAEGVEFQLVVTTKEFADYMATGCKRFAVLKIHGTVDRPETIVAVANHYKVAFALEKQQVFSHLLQTCPTLFVGYSGWDFEHTNYQQFWSEQSDEDAPPVYWLKGQGFSGGPNLRHVLGKHLGQRLRVGEGMLPQFICDVLAKWDDSGSRDVLKQDAMVDPNASKLVAMTRTKFLTEWVAAIPKPQLVSLLQIEVSVLNNKTQDNRQRRKNQLMTDTSAPMDNVAMAQLYAQLGTEMAEGKITSEEYMDQIQLVALDSSFANIVCSKLTREALKARFVREVKTNELFAGTLGVMNKSLFPGVVSSAIEGQPENASADEVYEDAIQFLEKLTKVSELAATDKRAEVWKNVYMYQSHYLRCNPQGRIEAERLMEAFVTKAVTMEWDATELVQRMTPEIGKKIANLAFGLVDIKPLLEYQFNTLLLAPGNEELKENALCVALALQKTALYLVGDLAQLPEYGQLISLPLNTGDKVLPEGNMEQFAEVCNQQGLTPSLTLRNKLDQLGLHSILAAFDLAFLCLLFELLKNSVSGNYIQSRALQKRGFYPKEMLTPQFIAYALPKLTQWCQNPGDTRNAQRLFGLCTSFAEAADELDLLRVACEESLKLTGNRVTELTPVGVPESYAYALQTRNRLRESLNLYIKALDGIKSSVVRPKADAIVLQACLVQAHFDKTKALKMAFTYSSYFSPSAQQFSTMGEGRMLLVQQCQHWARVDLGYASLEQAEAELNRKE
ncbi:hypothetical protein BASA81_005533 [Batrachochytrium salamandrivorans]|nr:hypothetical protein BASA81_005533 [Batrachochytrium salamandrivorans]